MSLCLALAPRRRSSLGPHAFLAGLALLGASLAAPAPVLAHCDTIDGPVVKDARAALAASDLTPALKWIAAPAEPELREAFAQAQGVRELGPAARALADRFFFETLVRLHRQGEGAPYTGLKPAGTEVEPGIAAADRALDQGALDPLLRLVTEAARQGLRERFARVSEARTHAGETVDKGRTYVAAYVAFVHCAEALLRAAASPSAHAAEAARIQAAAAGHQH